MNADKAASGATRLCGALEFSLRLTPKQGSWLNLVKGFFSELARSVLRHIRVASKRELKDRLVAAVEFLNGDPGSHIDLLDEAA
jgi:hypothetical protein